MEQSTRASERPLAGSVQRRSSSQILVAWLCVAAFACLVLWLGTPNFSASRSYAWVALVVRLLDPDATYQTILWWHHLIRKTMHLVVYGLLALLAFRASWLSFGHLLARVSATALLIAVGVAMIDESRQAGLPSRTGSPYDVLIDSAGAAATVALAFFAARSRLLRRRGRLEA